MKHIDHSKHQPEEKFFCGPGGGAKESKQAALKDVPVDYVSLPPCDVFQALSAYRFTAKINREHAIEGIAKFLRTQEQEAFDSFMAHSKDSFGRIRINEASDILSLVEEGAAAEGFPPLTEEQAKRAHTLLLDITGAQRNYLIDMRLKALVFRMFDRVHGNDARIFHEEGIPRPKNAVEGVVLSRVARGVFGAFDGNGRLQGGFREGETTMHEMYNEPLYREGKEDLERKAGVVRDVVAMMDLRVRALVEEDFSLSLSDLTLREQVWFIGALRDRADTDRVRAFARRFGIDGVRTFLATEAHAAFKDVIFDLAERLPEAEAARVFRAYAGLVEAAQSSTEAMEAALFKRPEAAVQADGDAILNTLLERANALLKKAGSMSSEVLARELGRSRADLLLFAAMFRQTFKGRESAVDFSALQGMALESRESVELSAKDRLEMLSIFDENWSDQDPIAAQSFRGMLEEKSSPTARGTRFYLLRKDGDLAAFLRFDARNDLEPGAFYAGSFNMRPALRGSAIGEAFMQQTVAKEAESHVLYAHVVPDAVVGTRYVEDGFVILGVDEVQVGDKKTDELAIRLDRQLNTRSAAKRPGVTPAHLFAGVEGVRVEAFNYANQKPAFLEAIRAAEKHGECVTRYWIDPKDPNMRYLAFESLDEESLRQAA